jgi:hypothetical protein
MVRSRHSTTHRVFQFLQILDSFNLWKDD